MKLSKANTILIIAILLFGGVVFSSVLNPVLAQTVQPTITPNPTITVLEERINTLEADVKLLNDRKDVDKQSLQNDVQKALLPVYIWFAILSAMGVSSAVGVWAWFKNFVENTKKQVEEETRQKLDLAFYNADPLYYPIYAPDDNEFEVEWRRLAKLGFRDIRPYGGLRPNILDGIVIFRVPGKNYEIAEDRAYAESALKTLEDFMIQNEFEKKKAAFVLYIAGSGRLLKANEIAVRYDNVAIANMPVTIAEHIYALVRGLTAPKNIKKEE
jgi:hypothetical protein